MEQSKKQEPFDLQNIEILFLTNRTRTKPQKVQLEALSTRAFGEDKPEFVEGIKLEWAGNFYHFIGILDGKMVSHVGILPRKIRLGGRTVKVAGIGNVATDPDYQKHGLAGTLLEKVNQWLDRRNPIPEERSDLAMLFCETKRASYYSRYGYSLIHQPLYIQLKGKRLPFQEPCMIRSLHGFQWQTSTIDLRGRPW